MNQETIQQIIYRELLNLLNSTHSNHLLAARELAEAFVPEPAHDRGDYVWKEGDFSPHLYFNAGGALVETDAKGMGTSIIRLVVPNSLFWCEDDFFYQQPSQTAIRCLSVAHVWVLRKSDLDRIHSRCQLGYDLINALSLKTLGNYRSRTAQLVQLSPEKRLAFALNQYPALLSLLTREELANFLSLSRSSLHRVLRHGYGRKK